MNITLDEEAYIIYKSIPAGLKAYVVKELLKMWNEDKGIINVFNAPRRGKEAFRVSDMLESIIGS